MDLKSYMARYEMNELNKKEGKEIHKKKEVHELCCCCCCSVMPALLFSPFFLIIQNKEQKHISGCYEERRNGQ